MRKMLWIAALVALFAAAQVAYVADAYAQARTGGGGNQGGRPGNSGPGDKNPPGNDPGGKPPG